MKSKLSMSYQPFDNIELQQSSFMNCFYFFFNIGSGGVKARQLLFLDQTEIKIQVDSREVRISFYSIQSKLSRNIGYEKMKQELKKIKQIPVVIAGGDGTMMWAIEQMLEQEIDIESVILIPLPCGTGNDFSIALGWGGDIPNDILGKEYSILKSYIQTWNRGHQCYFDIWDVTLQTADNGYIMEIVKTPQGAIKSSLKDLDGANVGKLQKKMSNYLSIGVDARIGYGFDKNRTESKFLNKICYCLEGIKKIFVKTKKVNQLIQFVEHHHKETQEQKTLFKTQDCLDKEALIVPGNPATLICLNINSYAGGIQHIWQNAKKPFQNKQYSDKTSFSDGLLEFFSFDSIIGIGGERIVSGNATRLAQTNGPLLIKFKEMEGQILDTYFQVDGQYFSIINPHSIQVEPCKQLPNGKIRVLLKD